MSQADRATKKTQTQVWLRRVDGSEARRLTWVGDRNAGARWSPDGTAIAFVSDRVKRSGIFVLPVDGGEARELARHGQAISDVAWSPDGTTIAYTILFDPENAAEQEPAPDAAPRVRVTRRIDYKHDNRGYLGDARFQVFVVDIASGQRRMVTSTAVDHYHPRWSPDSRALAVSIHNRNGVFSQLGLVDVASGATRLVGPETGSVGCWAWSPTGDRILFAGERTRTRQLDFFALDVASGEVRQLTEDLQVLPDSGLPTIVIRPPSQPVWLDDWRVLFHAFRAGASGLYVVDTRDGQVERVHTWQALHAGLSVDDRRRYAVQAHASLEAIGEISVLDLASDQSTVITANNVLLLQERPPAVWEKLVVQRGDFTIDTWLLKPPDFDPARRYPVVLDVHGGPNAYYGYGFSPVQQCLATHGFLVVFANPRGSTSYGRHFAQQVIRDWGGEDYCDLLAVVDAVLTRPYADRTRTGIFGHSYGGYMVAWAISQSDRFQAAVCAAPCFDLESLYGTSDISHAYGEIQWGGPPHELADWYRAHSPSTFAQQTRTPTLIVHGEADNRCPIGQGEQMFVALKQAGCEVEFVRYPGASHIFLLAGPPEHRADFLTRVLDWFTSHLGERS